MSKYYLYDGVTGSYHEARGAENLDIREPPTDVEEFDEGPCPTDVRSNSPELSASASRPRLWMSRSSRDLQYPIDHDQLRATGRADLGRPTTLDRAYTDPPSDTKRYDTDQPSDQRYITDYDLPYTDQPSTSGRDDMNRTPPNPNIQILTPIDEKRPIHQKLPHRNGIEDHQYTDLIQGTSSSTYHGLEVEAQHSNTEMSTPSANQNIQYLVRVDQYNLANQLPRHSIRHIMQYLVPVPTPEDKKREKEIYLEPADQFMSRSQDADKAGTSSGISPKVVYVWDTEGEPKPQKIDKGGIREMVKKIGIKFPEEEREFDENDLLLLRSSNPILRISKSVYIIVVLVVDFILQCVVVAQMGSNVKEGGGSSIEYENKKVTCEAEDSGTKMFTAYLVIVIFQGLFVALQVANIVGETMIDVRGRGFQIMHGFQETALSYLVNDIPLGALIIAFHGTCKLNVNDVSVTSIIMKLIKNITRKNTARQKPSVSIEIPLICYKWILYSTNKGDTCTFRRREWRIGFPVFFWNYIMYRDIGCCSDEKKACFLDAKPWKCASCKICCCIKVTSCHGIGCKETECCTCEPSCSLRGLCCICPLIIYLIVLLIYMTLFCIWLVTSSVLAFKIELCSRRNGQFFGAINKDFLRFQALYRILSVIHFFISIYVILQAREVLPWTKISHD